MDSMVITQITLAGGAPLPSTFLNRTDIPWYGQVERLFLHELPLPLQPPFALSYNKVRYLPPAYHSFPPPALNPHLDFAASPHAWE